MQTQALRNGFVGLSIKWDRKARQPGRLSFHLMPMAVFVLGICEELILFTTVKRVWYVCCGKTRKQTECDRQTGYTAHILYGIIDKLVRQIFERMKAIFKSVAA